MPSKRILPLYRKDTSQTSESNQRLRADSQPSNVLAPEPDRKIVWQYELVAATAEFVGTFMFLFFAFGGTQVAHTSTSNAPAPGHPPDTNVLLYIALSFGFSL